MQKLRDQHFGSVWILTQASQTKIWPQPNQVMAKIWCPIENSQTSKFWSYRLWKMPSISCTTFEAYLQHTQDAAGIFSRLNKYPFS